MILSVKVKPWCKLASIRRESNEFRWPSHTNTVRKSTSANTKYELERLQESVKLKSVKHTDHQLFKALGATRGLRACDVSLSRRTCQQQYTYMRCIHSLRQHVWCVNSVRQLAASTRCINSSASTRCINSVRQGYIVCTNARAAASTPMPGYSVFTNFRSQRIHQTKLHRLPRAELGTDTVQGTRMSERTSVTGMCLFTEPH